MDLENLMLTYADDLADRTKKKKPVIDPGSNTIGDVMEVFPDNVTVMDPRNLYVQDSKGIIDIRNTPQMLQEFGEAIGSNVQVDADFDMEPSTRTDMAVIEREIKDNPELNETMIKLARLVDIHFDTLTDTVKMESSRQLEEMRLTTTAIAQLQQAQVQDSELKEKLQKERIAYEQERDFDANRPIATPANPLPVSPYANNDPSQRQDENGPSLFDGLFGVGGGSGRGGRFARVGRIVGLVARGLMGLAGVLFLANEVTKKFFGKDLITIVKDGFKYILDNWDTLLMKGLSTIMDVIKQLPSMIGEAVKAIGITIKSVLLSIFEKIPFLKDMLDIPDTFDEIYDQQAAGDGGSGTSMLGTAAVAGASLYGAKKLKDSVQGMRRTPETFAEQAGKQGDPDTNRSNSTTKRGFFKGKGKLGLLLTAAGVLGMSFGEEDVAEFVDDSGNPVSADNQTPSTTQTSPQVERDEGMGGMAATAGLVAAGGAAYMLRDRAPDTTASVRSVPAGQERALPKPMTGNQATGIANDVAKKPGFGSKALRTLGRIPGLSILAAGVDAYSISQDDEMSDREKTKEYAGVGGTLAGAGAGAAVGSLLGPVGSIVGGLVGAYLGEEGVERVADWIMGPEPSEGQTATGSGVGAENVEKQEPFFLPDDFLYPDGDVPNYVMNQVVENNPMGPIPKPTNYVTVDQRQAQAQEEAQDIRQRQAESISEAKAEQMARAEANIPNVAEQAEVKTTIEPQAVDRDFDLIPGPALREEPVVTEVPGVETAVPPGETLRDQSPIQPEMNVTVQAPDTREKPKAVAKAVKPQVKNKVGHTSGYSDKPNLSNVPVTIEDSTFALVQLGYV